MLAECVKFGTVRKIVTPETDYYDGSVAVVFADIESAMNCGETMHGRWFDGRQIEVEMQGQVGDIEFGKAGLAQPVSLVGYADDEGSAEEEASENADRQLSQEPPGDDLEAFLKSL